MHILMLGDFQDLTFAYISWLAQQREFKVIKLNENTMGTEWSYFYSDNDMATGYVEIFEERYPIFSFRGAFVRLNPEPGLPENISLPLEEANVLIIERRYAIQHFLNSLPDTVIVANRPYSGRANGSKPYQMHLLAKAGFTVPKWITSNEEEVIKDFLHYCQNGLIYKSCSGLRSHVRKLDDQLLGRLHYGTSPVIAQEYIEGYDVRLHVVTHYTFATKVTSNGIDYRFENTGNQFQETLVPEPIRNMCISFTRSEHLTIAGFDFRVTEDGQWYCLEVNPVPTFLPYEMATGQAIGNTLLDAIVESSSQNN